jgi:type I restriction enzyme S subunit
MEKLLDGIEVEWKLLEQLVVDKFWIMPATPKFNEGETIPYITSKNIKGGHISFDKTKFISREDYIELSRNRPILAGDFLISMIGTIGEVAVVKESDLAFYGQNMYLIRLDETVIMSRYFWHFFDSPRMKSHFQAVKNNSGQGYLKANNIDKLEIPIPCPDNPEKSLAIQAEIVRILDAFTAMTAELTAELNMRKKQYNYYRDQLLSFEEGEVEWKTLGEVATLRRGRVMSKGYLEENSGEYPVYSSQTAKNGMIGSIDTFDFDGEFISWTTDGANAGTVFYRSGKFSITNVCGLIKINDESKLIYKYLYYWLTIEAQKHVYSGMGNPKLMSHQVEKIPVPIPCSGNEERSLNKQQRIVAILDKLEALTFSITAGLPREIELRQKQYEYYRELLLSFPQFPSSGGVPEGRGGS